MGNLFSIDDHNTHLSISNELVQLVYLDPQITPSHVPFPEIVLGKEFSLDSHCHHFCNSGLGLPLSHQRRFQFASHEPLKLREDKNSAPLASASILLSTATHLGLGFNFDNVPYYLSTMTYSKLGSDEMYVPWSADDLHSSSRWRVLLNPSFDFPPML